MHHAAGDKCSAGGMTACRPIPLIPRRLSGGNDHVLRDHLHRICVHMGIILKTTRGSFRTVSLRKEGPREPARQSQAGAHLASPRFLPVAVQTGPVEAQQ